MVRQYIKKLTKPGLAAISAIALLGGVLLITPANTVAAAVREVIVANTANNPVITHDVNTPKQTPYQKYLSMTYPTDQLGVSASFTVPAGKRFVIENVSANTTNEQGLVVAFGVTTTTGGTSANHAFTVTPQGAAGGLSQSYTVAQATKLYADGGTTVSAGFARQLGGAGGATVALSGYLVNQ